MAAPHHKRRVSDSGTVETSSTAPSSATAPSSDLSAALTPSESNAAPSSTLTYDADDTLTVTSTASSPRSHFSDETIDLLPADELTLTNSAGPPTTVPIIREDAPSPPPAYSLHQPSDSIWPAVAPALYDPQQPLLQRETTHDHAATLQHQTALARRAEETLPLNRSWAFNQGPLYGQNANYGATTLVQINNNYGGAGPAPGASSLVWAGASDQDAEIQRLQQQWSATEPRRVKMAQVGVVGRHLCRCCCCTCSWVVVAIVVVLAVTATGLGLGLGGVPDVVHKPEKGDG